MDSLEVLKYLLMGPVGFIMDPSPENKISGVAILMVLSGCGLLPLVVHKWWANMVSLMAIVGWLLCGVLAHGIEC